MDNKTLIKYWKHVNYEQLKSNGLDHDEALDIVQDSTYEPLSLELCIVTTDDIAILVKAKNGLFISSEEMVRF